MGGIEDTSTGVRDLLFCLSMTGCRWRSAQFGTHNRFAIRDEGKVKTIRS